MTSSISRYLGRELGDHVFGCGTRNFTAPTSIWVALFRVAPAQDGTGGTEASYGGYARVETDDTDWTSASSTGQLSNSNKVIFPEATSDEGAAIVAACLFDASVGGNLLWIIDLADQTKEPLAGDKPEFQVGDLDVDMNANTTGATNYLAQEILDHAFGAGNRDYTPPADLYVAGFTAVPSDPGGGTEANYTSYARVATDEATWIAAASNGTIANLLEIKFPRATGDEGQDWVALGIFDASTSGNLLLWGNMATDREPLTDDVPVFRQGKLIFDWVHP